MKNDAVTTQTNETTPKIISNKKEVNIRHNFLFFKKIQLSKLNNHQTHFSNVLKLHNLFLITTNPWKPSNPNILFLGYFSIGSLLHWIFRSNADVKRTSMQFITIIEKRYLQLQIIDNLLIKYRDLNNNPLIKHQSKCSSSSGIHLLNNDRSYWHFEWDKR